VPLALSVVVVAYEMARELPRTLRSLAPGYQGGMDAGEYEVIVVDNGSVSPVDEEMLASFPGRLRHTRLAPAPRSPAKAANTGIEMARGAVIATLAWHLGPADHRDAEASGYDHASEDRLLEDCRWEDDGYQLFALSILAGASRRGWFGPLGESNALFMPRSMWAELGGLDERFALPGGGLVNSDLYYRACGLDGVQLVVLLGEGTFHQIHGGASTSLQITRAQVEAEYEALRGHPHAAPTNEPLYFGRVPPTTLAHLEYSVKWAMRPRAR
jgi:hypothetical protein